MSAVDSKTHLWFTCKCRGCSASIPGVVVVAAIVMVAAKFDFGSMGMNQFYGVACTTAPFVLVEN
jgi:hypothetical protein